MWRAGPTLFEAEAACVGLGFACTALVLVGSEWLRSAIVMGLGVAGIGVVIGLSVLAPAWHRRRMFRRLRAARMRLCPGCLYHRTDGSERCPECGWPGTAREMRRSWRRSFRHAEDTYHPPSGLWQ